MEWRSQYAIRILVLFSRNFSHFYSLKLILQHFERLKFHSLLYDRLNCFFVFILYAYILYVLPLFYTGMFSLTMGCESLYRIQCKNAYIARKKFRLYKGTFCYISFALFWMYPFVIAFIPWTTFTRNSSLKMYVCNI